MKSKLLVAFAFAASVISSQAVVVQYQTTFDQAVTTSTGTLIPDQGGFTSVGYFTISDSALVTASADDLVASFRAFGASGVFGFNGIGGVYDSTASGGRVGVGSEFLGKNIYVLNTNALTIGGSSQALIFKSNSTFVNDSGEALDAQALVALGQSGSYVFGGASGPNVELTPGFSVPSVQMAVLVPEPSAALLGAVGAIGLLRRRRN